MTFARDLLQAGAGAQSYDWLLVRRAISARSRDATLFLREYLRLLVGGGVLRGGVALLGGRPLGGGPAPADRRHIGVLGDEGEPRAR